MDAIQRLGRQLRAERQKNRMSLADLAEIAGCSRQHIHQVERARGNPTVSFIERLAHALEKELDMHLVDANRKPTSAGSQVDDLLAWSNKDDRAELQAWLSRLDGKRTRIEEKRKELIAGGVDPRKAWQQATTATEQEDAR